MAPARSRRAVAIVGMSLAALLAGACAPTTGEETRADVETTTPGPPTRATTAALWDVTADLLRAVADARPDSNAVLAPVPISLGLAQAAAGAEGATRDQLDEVLHDVEGFDQGLAALWNELRSRSGAQTNDATGRTGRLSVDLASSLWAQRNTSFEDPWLETLARTWDAGIRETDFRSDPEQARRTVNRWAADATNDQITQLLPRGALDELTTFMATSAAYLRAPWSTPFAPSATGVAEFRRLDGSREAVPLMQRVDETAGRAEGPGWRSVTLAYLGDELDLTVVLPDEGRFGAVERALDGDALADLLASTRRAPVDVSLPRFGFTTDLDLVDPLRALGAADAFDPLLADFTGISADEALSLAGVAHQTYFAVDEEGTEGSGTRPTTTTRQPTTTIPTTADGPPVPTTAASTSRCSRPPDRDRPTVPGHRERPGHGGAAALRPGGLTPRLNGAHGGGHEDRRASALSATNRDLEACGRRPGQHHRGRPVGHEAAIDRVAVLHLGAPRGQQPRRIAGPHTHVGEGLLDDHPRHGVGDVVEHVEIGHAGQPRDHHHPGVVHVDRAVAQATVDLTSVGRRAVQRLEGIAQRRRSTGDGIDVHPDRHGLGAPAGRPSHRHPALGPATPQTRAERRQRDLLAEAQRRVLFDHGAAHHPVPRAAKIRVGGVVTRHVLHETGQPVEADAAVAADVTEPDGARGPKHPSDPGEREDLDRSRGPRGAAGAWRRTRSWDRDATGARPLDRRRRARSHGPVEKPR